MNTKKTILLIILAQLLRVSANPAIADTWEFNNILSAQYSFFTQAPSHEGQKGNSASIAIEPELYTSWDDDYQSLTLKAFYRYDEQYSHRNHADIRELSWLKISDDWELQLGVSSVYWGVTESLHLVDIINQADILENPDATVKLGQAMLRLALLKDWGTTSVFVLPYFRARDFADEGGRFRGPIMLESKAYYKSSAKEKHIDFAIRWEHTIDNIDIGVSYFDGTDRIPSVKPIVSTVDHELKLHPYYDQMQQLSLDVQLTQDAWLWKLEAINKNRETLLSYFAGVGGFEYTFYSIFTSAIDLGVLVEYQFNNLESKNSYPGDNDVFFGLRAGFNDEQSSELLLGLIADPSNHGQIYSIKGSRRIGEDWKLSTEGRVFHKLPLYDPLNGLMNDDFIRIDLAWYWSK